MRVRTILALTVPLAVTAAATVVALRLTPSASEVVVRPDPVTIVLEMQQLARLETATLTAQKTIKATRGEGKLWGALEETLLLVATGDVVAGVDLSELEATDITVGADGGIVVRLPEPSVWRVDLDEDATYVAHRDRGWLADTDMLLETHARRNAARELRGEALRMGILDEARAGAEIAITTLLEDLGVAGAVVVTGPVPSS